MFLLGTPVMQSKEHIYSLLLEVFRIFSKEGGDECMYIVRKSLSTHCHLYRYSVLNSTLKTLLATESS